MGSVIPVKLPDRTVEEIDELIREGRFLSRSNLLRQATRLLIDFERGRLTLHRLAEEYAYFEVKRKLRPRADAFAAQLKACVSGSKVKATELKHIWRVRHPHD